MHFSMQSLALATALLINGVLAGAGAQVKACVWFTTKPHSPVQFNWNTCGSSSHCMYCSGLPKPTMTVSEAGMTCVDLGKVESKSSNTMFFDFCSTDESHWELSYNSPSSSYSGSVSSRWRGGGLRHNYIEFDKDKYSAGTSVCGTKSACVDTQTNWDSGSEPDIYFVFRPQQQQGKTWAAEGISAKEYADVGKAAIFHDQSDL
ncbi:hypothetical protein BBK36DRAFT_1167104 [Trichoderma citrinoviride]|uniref:Uncharacterized protein n=1 Tax=Trichoderma citrinoviride TaxID=58853 RepID=A0A2T4BEN6_9HYPO|nr:hypothetical protein BBK36DRAFT_1167104 [Trichoderma citrinoviride]PTB67800.1 hypothetical protein BBK36DRAFT_1167104 [Trichoderma citrinoviride]